MGGADIDDISRLDGLRDAAERAGVSRARNAEHYGDVSTGTDGIWFSEDIARHDRGQETCVHGLGEVYRRPSGAEAAGGKAAFQRVGGAAREADQRGPC